MPTNYSFRYNILHSCLTELMGKGIITPSEELAQECTGVEAQLQTLAQAHFPLPPSTAFTTNTNVAKGKSANSTQARKTAARVQELHRAAQAAALQAFVHSVTVPDFDAVELMDIAEHTLDNNHDQDINQDQEAVMEIESSSNASEMGSSAESQSSASESLTPAVDRVHIGRAAGSESVNSPCSSAEAAEEGEVLEGRRSEDFVEGEEEEEQGGTAFELGLTPEQYLYVVAALCQVRDFLGPLYLSTIEKTCSNETN